MRRVLVLGPPGSGKSTLARSIGARHGLPVFHLDQAYWRPGWVETPPAEFLAEVTRVAALPAWVIDGNYVDTIAPRLQRADTLIYLDVPTWLCLLRITARTLWNYGRVRQDAAPGCLERWDGSFYRFAWSWNRLRRERSLALLQRFAGRTMVLQGRRWLTDQART